MRGYCRTERCPVGGDLGAGIGFHQDWKYWQFFDELEGVITAWVALSDITAAGGAMRFVPGSHRWGLIDPGNFGEKDETRAIAALPLPEGERWREHAAVMPAGAASFHHPLTLHGSGANHAAEPRRAIAVHYVSERARVVAANPTCRRRPSPASGRTRRSTPPAPEGVATRRARLERPPRPVTRWRTPCRRASRRRARRPPPRASR